MTDRPAQDCPAECGLSDTSPREIIEAAASSTDSNVADSHAVHAAAAVDPSNDDAADSTPQRQRRGKGQGRRGAPADNSNAATRGGLMSRNPVRITPFADGRFGIALSSLPKGFNHVRRHCDELRKCLEALVAERGDGRVSLADAMHISTVLRWERHSQIAANLLRKNFDEMSVSDRLACSRDTAMASANRDKALAALKLDTADIDPLADFAGLTLPAISSSNRAARDRGLTPQQDARE